MSKRQTESAAITDLAVGSHRRGPVPQRSRPFRDIAVAGQAIRE